MIRINLLPKEQRRRSQRSPLKKFLQSLVLPASTLVFVFIAAGSVVTVATTSTDLSVAKPAPAAPAKSPLQSLCAQYWGVMGQDGSYCEFEQTFHLNITHAGQETLVTRVPLVAGDTVSISAVNNPHAIVGSESFGTYGGQFTATSGGYLSFRATSPIGLFSVKQVRVLRCYREQAGALVSAVCPNA